MELTKIIQNLTKNDLKTLGLKMKSIAERRYKWEIIAEKYKQLFIEVLLAGKNKFKQSIFSY